MSDMVRLKNNRGADEANDSGVAYKIHSDGCFFVPESVAQRLLASPAGFYRPRPDERPEAGTASIEEAVDTIFALEPGPIRAALLTALSTAGAL
jgi:hypothetical protein